MTEKANKIIRNAAKEKGVPLWRVAGRLGFSEPTMTRKLRYELSEAECKSFLNIIDELSKEVKK